MEGGSVRHNFERDPPKDHPCQVWFKGFRGEDLNVKVHDRRQRTPSDGKSSLGLWPRELKRYVKFLYHYYQLIRNIFQVILSKIT